MVAASDIKTAFTELFNHPDLFGLSAEDRIQSLLQLMVDAGPGGDGEGGTSQATIEAAIEAAGNLDQIEPLLQAVRDRLPSALVSGRLAVDVASLSVSVNNAQLEIANDVGNPLPVQSVDSIFATGTITANDTASTTSTGADGQRIITGSPTANSAVTIATSGNSSFIAMITGTFGGDMTLLFDRSIDGGTTWNRIAVVSAEKALAQNSVASPGLFQGNAAGATHIRVRARTVTGGAMTGSALVRLVAGQGVGTVSINHPLRLHDQISDREFTIKPENSKSVQGDTAIVVTERPSPASSYSQSSVSVGTSSTTVVGSSLSRRHLLLVNRGTTVCYLMLGATATTDGIPLNPASVAGQAGGVYEINSDNLFTGAINAICASGSTTIAVAEGV